MNNNTNNLLIDESLQDKDISLSIIEVHNINNQTKTTHTEIYKKGLFIIGYSHTEKVKPYE